MRIPPPPLPDTQAFARGAPPRKSDVLANFGVGAGEFKFRAKTSPWLIFASTDPNHAGFSGPASSWTSFSGNIGMPAEFAVFLAPQASDSASQPAEDEPPGNFLPRDGGKHSRGATRAQIDAKPR